MNTTQSFTKHSNNACNNQNMRFTATKLFHLTWNSLLTSTEVATALRPFYFAVHPDLFGQFPKERTINENSLKQLSAFIETLQKSRYAQPCSIAFYIRDGKTSEEKTKGSFKLVKLDLKERDIRTVVLKVLKSCDLSTEFIDKLPQSQNDTRSTSSFRFERYDRANDIDLTNLDPNDVIFGPLAVKRKIKEAQEDLRLGKWLDANYKEALSRSRQTLPMREDIEALSRTLSEELQLIDLRWDCGWNIQHFKGCLQSLSALIQEHPNDMRCLQGRILVFAPFTGVSLDGHIMLNSGEVRHNWLDLIKNIPKYDEHLERIPAFEKAVSQVLRDIRVMRRKFMPKILAGEYERHLQQITTSLSDFLTYRKYPQTWPKSLSKFEIVVETEAGPLMVSPTGQFIVPASCPGFLLVSFIDENMDAALEHMQRYEKDKHVERSLQERCKINLQLLSIRKDDNVTPEMMIACCEQLLDNHKRLTAITNGLRLNISTYYSVLSDGVVCIPWNGKL